MKKPQLTNKKGIMKIENNKKETMKTEKKIYYSDLINYVDVCYSCSSQNIVLCNHEDDGRESFCNDCNSEDIGSVAPEDVL